MIRQILFDNRQDYREEFANASHPFYSLILSIPLLFQRQQSKIHVIPYSLPMEPSQKVSTHATSILLKNSTPTPFDSHFILLKLLNDFDWFINQPSVHFPLFAEPVKFF